MARTRAENKQRTRECVYATAMTLFDKHGYDAVNVDDIVRASRVARGTFYFHFPQKDDVLLEAVRRGEALILRRIDEIGPDASVHAVLSATIAAFAEAWGERRQLLPHAGAVALRRIAGIREESDRDPMRLELGRRMQQAQARGELRSNLPATMLADLFLVDVFAALMSWSVTGEPPLDVVMPAIVELFFGGVEGLDRAGRATPKVPSPARRGGGGRTRSP